MPSSEFTELVERNAEFLAVRRSGRGDGNCGLYHAVTGEFVMGIGGGMLPEYTFYANDGNACVRGWKNLLFDLVRKRSVRNTREVRVALGSHWMQRALDNHHQELPYAPANDQRIYAHEAAKMATHV